MSLGKENSTDRDVGPDQTTVTVAPPVRLPIAVIVSRFPKTTETFILRELMEMERQGQPVRLVPLLSEKHEVVHPDAAGWVRRALYTPFLSPSILVANLITFWRRPLRYLQTFLHIVAGSGRSLNLLFGTLGIFPKSVYLGARLAEEGIAHVHAHFATHPAMSALIIRRLSGVPYSFTVHAHDIFLHEAFHDEKIDQACFVRAISDFNRKFLEDAFPDSAPGKVETLYLGVDPLAFSAAGDSGPEDTSAEGVGPVPTILCVAAFRPYKGLPILVGACRLLKEKGIAFSCKLIGDGPQRQEIEQLIARHGLQEDVRLLGALPETAVAEHLKAASLFVLPSIVAPSGQMDGIPVVLMEAMAAGLPVVSSALSGIPELVEDGVNGLVVEPESDEELADAMARLIAEPEQAARLARRGRQTVQTRFSLAASVGGLLARIDQSTPEAPREIRAIVDASGLPYSRLGMRRARRGSRSRVYHLLLASSRQTRELVLKVHPPRPEPERPPAARAAREFETLKQLHDRLSPSTAGAVDPVPRPVFVDERSGAVLMEACTGTSLEALLRRGRWRRERAGFGELVIAVERSGEWLRRFQAVTRGTGNPRLALEGALREARQDLADCEQRWISSSFARRVENRMARLASQLDPDRFSLCGVHQDFGPGNLFFSEGTVQVIDFEGFVEGHPYLDPAYFLVHTELFLAYPGLSARFRRLERAFLRGYLAEDAIDGAALNLMRVAMAAQMLARTRRESEGSRLQLERRIRRLRSMVRS